VLITSCDSHPGYRCAQWMLKKREHFDRIVCGASDKNNKFMRDLKEMGAELVEYDPNDRDRLQKIFERVDYVHVIPPMRQERVEAARAMLEACGKAGVCASFSSVLNCDKARSHHMKQLCEIEEAGKRAGIKRLCIVRNGFMLETFFGYSEQLQQGKLPLPTKNGRFAPVSYDDICQAALNAMLKHMEESDDRRGQVETLEFTGNHLMAGQEIARKASEALDTRVELEDISMDRARELLSRNKDMGRNEVELVIEMFEMIREGHFERMTDDLKKLLREEPTSVEQFFQKNAHEFKPRR